MGKELSDNQKTHLKSILGTPGHIPAITFASLRDAGLVKKVDRPTDVAAAGRGKVYAIATPAGDLAAIGGV